MLFRSENTDTQAVMCIGAFEDTSYHDKDIIKISLAVMEAREENTYAKGIQAYEAWKEMLLQEKWFENGSTFDTLFSMFLVQNDAMTCLQDGRKWAASYFEELADQREDAEKKLCMDISASFLKVSKAAEDMKDLIGDWSDTKAMLDNFGSRQIREKLGQLIDACQREDRRAYEQLNLLYQRYFSNK